MLEQSSIKIFAIAAALVTSATVVQGFDDATYPDLSGQWASIRQRGVDGQGAFDPTKGWGLSQQAPLTPEYQAVLEASIANQNNGGQGNWPMGTKCLPPGMPAMMNIYTAMEIIVLPEITYVLIDHGYDLKSQDLH